MNRATKRNFREPCMHRLKRGIILEEKRDRFMPKRYYRKLWKDRELYGPWHCYSVYLKFKRKQSELDSRFVFNHGDLF